ncbi:MAG TPA: hypothetical protein VF586_02060 [Pyrinomonadaceae bacterium]
MRRFRAAGPLLLIPLLLTAAVWVLLPGGRGNCRSNACELHPVTSVEVLK